MANAEPRINQHAGDLAAEMGSKPMVIAPGVVLLR